jgi:hypothetical protein
VIPASAAIDNIEVRPEVEPLAMALMGTALTDDNVIGVDLMCGSTDPASLGRIQLVATQVAGGDQLDYWRRLQTSPTAVVGR